MISTERGISMREGEEQMEKLVTLLMWLSGKKTISLRDEHSENAGLVMISTDEGISIRESEEQMEKPEISLRSLSGKKQLH
jgi:hypothetical protein